MELQDSEPTFYDAEKTLHVFPHAFQSAAPLCLGIGEGALQGRHENRPLNPHKRVIKPEGGGVEDVSLDVSFPTLANTWEHSYRYINIFQLLLYNATTTPRLRFKFEPVCKSFDYYKQMKLSNFRDANR